MNIALIRQIIPLILGGIAGYAVYKYIGCRSGVCPITSNPYMSIGYGVLIGMILSRG